MFPDASTACCGRCFRALRDGRSPVQVRRWATMTERVEQLVAAVERIIAGSPASWPGGWPGEADTAIVDAVFSTRANYRTTVLPLVRRYRQWDQRPASGRASALLEVDEAALL